MKFALPFLVIIISGAVYFMYISPTMNEISVLSAKKSEYINVLEKTKELKTKRDAALIDYNNISEEDIDRLNKIIPETFNAVLFANDLNTMASLSGMVVKDFNIDDSKTEDRSAVADPTDIQPYKTINISFKVNGQYSQFEKFLSNLESSLRLVDVVGLSIRPSGGSKAGDVSLEFLLNMHAYYLR